VRVLMAKNSEEGASSCRPVAWWSILAGLRGIFQTVSMTSSCIEARLAITPRH